MCCHVIGDNGIKNVNINIIGLLMEWRGIARLFLVLSFLTMFLCLFIPESPGWLRKFRPSEEEEAKGALAWLYRNPKVRTFTLTSSLH